MDGSQFDDLLRVLTRSRRSVLGMASAAVGGVIGPSFIDAKKKKPCKKKCGDGCCTSKKGKCIKPAQQSATQCGTGGEICRTNCGGGGETCTATCAGCCAGSTCVDPNSDSQCGRGGVACEACTGDEVCQGTCCVPLQKSCTNGGTACCFGECRDGTCCSDNQGVCQQSSDCCDSANSACENGQCVTKTGSACQPGWMCQGGLSCPASNICDTCPEGQIPCGNDGCCPSGNCCESSGTCCTFQCCLSADPVHSYCCETENCCT